ncbi:MAG: bifunctional DNA-formamidopyrimidine glycosylase/DNA-(apurinic or apyrimidinic site) lyase [Gammaproteobacteria bacterium]|nr:bifunctional DNA-formamidopyrimidine glycosylase/DNA-(apurinic or apyrimidinic site) lyase [Gammaproteobacteria bacterium]MCW8910039.1 bifunctional DNA-formamidopyrimidine glycosylase/DNA-(apurinic or apyrimidinic site) lyase [Gammaproteobacteria bacterium]MCW9005328.1 bifunctional DNA-formamidopyrimidine glycosylase/DNA-(apurinic or apyrimidinic site) lyase [Gammaproteobacteria bacterium]MCW9056997.1 bifunctional DNA-formamidopyrimidine glycosylase/DNA-(apurinic or apyrimidinic site) lyase [
MPELPEVETSRRGIEPHIINKKIINVIIRQKKLRWPIPVSLKKNLPGDQITSVSRRGKYLLLKTSKGTLIIHLGMSGSLHIVSNKISAEKHDHFEIEFSNGKLLRLRDPRRFGAVLWTRQDTSKHKLIEKLGPEPLTDEFTADYLYQASRKRKIAIKTFIMNSHIVVGVGNIYANEALFTAGIHPKRMSHRISLARYQQLVEVIKKILHKAIEQGGTTLRDFSSADGKPGYFQQKLNIYGKVDQPCPICNQTVKHIRQQQRSTYYCSHCQN